MDETALVGLTPQADNQSQQRTVEYFEQLKASNDGWKLCIAELNGKITNNNESVQFFCFQVLEHYLRNSYSSCSRDEHMLMKTFLLEYLHQKGTQQANDKAFLRNKAAQVFALAFVVDYPHRWPDFLLDILPLLKLGQGVADIFLRILMALDSEVVDREVTHTAQETQRNTLIKDSLRVQVVPRIVQSWHEILIQYDSTETDLVCFCLDVIGTYVSWIDIALIANDRFVSLLLRFLTVADLRESACDCVLEIVQKGMDPAAKTKLIESFDVALNNAGIFPKDHDDESEDDFELKLAKLTNGMTIQLISAWQKTVKAGDEVLANNILQAMERKVPLVLHFFERNDDDVSSAMTSCVRDYVNHVLKSQAARSPTQRGQFKNLLRIVIDKMMYSSDYNFEHEGDEELEFQEFRKELKVLFTNLGSMDTQLIMKFVASSVPNSLQCETAPFFQVEIAITIIYLLAEIPGIPTPHFSPDCDKPTNLQLLMRALMRSHASRHPHRAVVLQFFEVVVRYAKFFNHETQFLQDTLYAFLDERGVHHDVAHIRSRAAYLFCRFIKEINKNLLNRYVDGMLRKLQDVLVLGSPYNGQRRLVTHEDQLFIYEAASILIVQCEVPMQSRGDMMRALLAPLVSRFNELLYGLMEEQNEERQLLYSRLLCYAMAFASRATKGFSNSLTMQSCGCVQVFKETLAIFLCALKCPVQRPALHAGVRGFLHRMVVCLGQEVLPFIPMTTEQLLKDADARELHDFIPLLNQTVTKFKKDMVPYITSIFMPLLSAIFAALRAPADERDQVAATERRMLQRSYFSFLSTLVNCHVTDVLSNQEPAHLEQVLHTVIQGAVEVPDPQGQKLCFSVLRRLTETWGAREGGLPGFDAFLYGNIVPACFSAPLKPTFDLGDAQTVLVLNECADCLKSVHDRRGEEFTNFLEKDYFPKQAVSPPIAQEICLELKQDNKRFRQYFKQFYLRAKS